MSASLVALIHGESGAGKSWFMDTSPPPRLVLDVEGRAKHTPSQPKVFWDPQRQSPPEDDGSWVTCVVSVTSYSILETVYQWLRSGRHPFKSVCVDSLMEAQKRFIDAHKGLDPLTTQDWGVVLRNLESFVRNLRDLAVMELPTDVVIISTGTIPDENNVRRPLLQGQLKMTLPYFVDVVGYLFVAPVEGGGYRRELLVQSSPSAVAKDGTGKLGGPVIANPNITQLYELLERT